mgnify:CR=1
MKLINLRTICCLFLTTLAYAAYYIYGFNQKIAQPVVESNSINSYLLQNNPLLWLYLISITLVLALGIISKIREDRMQAKINQRKQKKQRNNYSI